MNSKYVVGIINNAGHIGVPLIFKGETFMVHRQKDVYRIITAYYNDLMHTEIFRLISSITTSVQILLDHGMNSLSATVNLQELQILIDRVDKIGTI